MNSTKSSQEGVHGATMYPPHCPSEGVSPPELKVFDLFKNDPEASGWSVLHQLNVGSHVRRSLGEIDFVVLAPGLGIFSLEVKGKIRLTEKREWEYLYDNKWTKGKSPFYQAQQGMFDIKKLVSAHRGEDSSLTKLLYSFGVLIRGTAINKTSMEFAPWQVWDQSKNDVPISKFIQRLGKNASENIPEKYREDAKPTPDDIEFLLETLRPPFEAPTSYLETEADVEYALFKFTEDQLDVLDGLEESRKAFVKGAAGTGKTFIACELAKRALSKGHSVLLTYYTKGLKADIERFLGPETAVDKKLRVTHFHSAMDAILKKYDPDRSHGSGYEWYRTDMPLHAAEALSQNRDEFNKFDTVIIDEGQDLVTEPYMMVVDEMLDGGLREGMCYIFGDVERQAIFDNDPEKINALLNEYAFARYPLFTNCRNTKEVAETFSHMSGFERPSRFLSEISGPPVDYVFFIDDDDHNSKLDDTIKRLLKAGEKGEDIVILSGRRFEKSSVAKLEPPISNRYRIVDPRIKGNFRSGSEFIQYHTIHSFKGRESKCVIITDVFCGPLNDQSSRLYVGMSRARVKLILFVTDKYRYLIDKFKNEKQEFDLLSSLMFPGKGTGE